MGPLAQLRKKFFTPLTDQLCVGRQGTERGCDFSSSEMMRAKVTSVLSSLVALSMISGDPSAPPHQIGDLQQRDVPAIAGIRRACDRVPLIIRRARSLPRLPGLSAGSRGRTSLNQRPCSRRPPC